MTNRVVRTIDELHFSRNKICAHEDLGQPTQLRSLWIEIPKSCHLECSYCFAKPGARNIPKSGARNIPKKASWLKGSDYLHLVKEFGQLGGRHLGIPGAGEPFIRENRSLVMEILRTATMAGIRTTVFTTGETIFLDDAGIKGYREIGNRAHTNDEMVDYLNSNANDCLAEELLELDVILLAKCNHLDPKVQDELVGDVRGYAEARNWALKRLIDKGFAGKNENRRLGIVTSIMPENKDAILDLYEYANSYNLIFDCDTILPRGRGETFSIEHQLSSAECLEIFQRLEKKTGGTFRSGGTYVGIACDRMKHHLYVDLEGNVYPCIGCVDTRYGDTLCLGNVRDKGLDGIWRSRLRQALAKNQKMHFTGICARCAKFGESCWSCLGRSVECLNTEAGITTFETHGCHNHEPKLEHWLSACSEAFSERLRIIPKKVRKPIADAFGKNGVEWLWSTMPTWRKNTNSEAKALFKDTTISDMPTSLGQIWNALDIVRGEFTVNKSDMFSARSMQEECRSLLPNLIEPSYLLFLSRNDPQSIPGRLAESCINPQFVPSTGLVQFCNLMFYMPLQERYFYRTIASNQLDAGCTKGKVLERSDREHLHRKATLMQRWAEAFDINKPAAIIPYILNFSEFMERHEVEVYELILGNECYKESSAECNSNNGIGQAEINNRGIIQTENDSDDEHILFLGPLIDSPSIEVRCKKLDDILEKTILDLKWKEVEQIFSGIVWAGTGNEGIRRLRELYEKELPSVFFKLNQEADTKDDLYAELRARCLKTIEENIFPLHNAERNDTEKCEVDDFSTLIEALNELFPKDKTIDSYSNLKQRLSSVWHECENDGPARKDIEILDRLLRKYGIDVAASSRRHLAKRLFRPLLFQLIESFIVYPNKKRLDSDKTTWVLMTNYLIWLGYFRHYLDINSYYVGHVPNIAARAHSLLGKQGSPLKPYGHPRSGFCLMLSSRLTSIARQEWLSLFRAIVEPIQSLTYVNWSLHEGLEAGITREQDAFSHSAGTFFRMFCDEARENAKSYRTIHGLKMLSSDLSLWGTKPIESESKAVPLERILREGAFTAYEKLEKRSQNIVRQFDIYETKTSDDIVRAEIKTRLRDFPIEMPYEEGESNKLIRDRMKKHRDVISDKMIAWIAESCEQTISWPPPEDVQLHTTCYDLIQIAIEHSFAQCLFHGIISHIQFREKQIVNPAGHFINWYIGPEPGNSSRFLVKFKNITNKGQDIFQWKNTDDYAKWERCRQRFKQHSTKNKNIADFDCNLEPVQQDPPEAWWFHIQWSFDDEVINCPRDFEGVRAYAE